MSLFDPEPEADAPPPAPTPDVVYRHGLFRRRWTLEQLQAVLPLEQREARMYGQVLPVPRLECWHGPRPYAFGGRVEQPQPWPELLEDVRAAVNAQAFLDGVIVPGDLPFDSCFANLYRNGDDHIPWHSDDEPWMGPTIASVTFGEARPFRLRHKATGSTVTYRLGDGDLLIMRAGTQRDWEHCAPRVRGLAQARLNLTFRQTVLVGRG